MNQPLITGTTRLAGIIGSPVAHSLSPQIHNHLFRTFDLPCVYVPLPAGREALPALIRSLRAIDFAGANITVPYKSAIVPLCDVISPLSELTGTVNTVYMRSGLLHGTTTDPEGFFKAVDAMGVSCEAASVVILGNGGTARTLSMAIASGRNAGSLAIIGRNRDKVETLAAEIVTRTGFITRGAVLNSAEANQLLERCDLLVNCTSVGMSPHTSVSPLPRESLHAHTAVFDAIYNPAETLLLRDAADAGCRVQNGLRMLVYQALASFQCWTGIMATIDHIDLTELQSLM